MTAYDNIILSTAGLVHYWTLDEAMGASTAADSKGSQNGANTGVTAGFAGLLTDGSTCYSMATSGSEIDLGAALAYGPSLAHSLELWITRQSASFPYLFSSSNATDSAGTSIWCDGSNQLHYNGLGLGFVPTTGTTYHLVWCSDGSFYVNGVLTMTIGTNWATNNTGLVHAYIGRPVDLSNGASWAGDIQKVAWYNVALTATQVRLHYEAGVPGGNDGWGDNGVSGGAGTYAEPYILVGSGILPLSSPMRALAARAHRRAYIQRNDVELWYMDRSNGNWYLFPSQPIMTMGKEIVLTRTYRQPFTLACNLLDQGGLLTPENANSPYNYNQASQYDQLVDEARKIVLRGGCWCYFNSASGIAPTSTLAPSFNSLSALTDGILGDISGTSTQFVTFTPTSAATFDLVIDLGSVQQVHHVVIRFGSRIGICTLPAAVTFSTSADNITWTDQPARPVGGAGGAGVPTGDWDDDYDGRNIDVIRTDIEEPARYVRFRILPTGAQTIMTDELAVYAGGAGGMLGRNMFTGYLGDQIQFTPEGMCQFTATDVLKKLSDNNEVRLTDVYQNQDIGDIAWTMLTQATDWPGTGTAYDAPFATDEVGWASGSAITGLLMPIWQSNGNNMLGYQQDLWNEVGWWFYADGNGVLQVLEPPFKQRLPDRVCIADIDGCRDVRDCVRDRTGKDLRNVVDVSCSDTIGGGASSIVTDPNSVAKYGHRRVIISDPVAQTKDLRIAIGQSILRDYNYRLQTLANAITPDFDSQIKQIFGFRAPARPHMFAKAGSVTGDQRLRELWSMNSLTEHICPGQWWADATWIPYVPGGPDPPQDMTLSSPATSTSVVVTWTLLTDPHAVSVRGYLSTTSANGGFTQQFQIASIFITDTITGLINGNEVWIYLTTVDDQDQESIPSSVVAILVGGGSASTSGWAISDLSAGFNSVTGPDARGTYTYEFNLDWTAPDNGCKRWQVFYSIGALPTNPTDMTEWKYQDEFHGVWQPPGTPLSWLPRINVPAALASGSKVYIRMLTSDRNTSDGGVWPESNVVFVTIP